MKDCMITASVLILVIICLRALFRGKISRRLQYAMWGLVLLRLLMPFPLIGSQLSVMNAVSTARNPAATYTVPTAVETPDTASAMIYTDTAETNYAAMQPENEQETAEAVAAAPLSAAGVLKIVWLAGSAVVVLWVFYTNVAFFRRLKRSRKPYDAKCTLPVYITDQIASPCLFGLFHPVVYLTSRAAENEDSLRYVLAHEERHYSHGDHIWSALRMLCLAAYWWNPLVWAAAILSREDSELACDEAVVKRIGEENRLAYGRTLVDMISVRKPASGIACAATTMVSGKRGIRERINMIVKRPKTLIPALLAVVAIVAVCIGATFTGAKADKAAPQGDDPSYAQQLYDLRNPYIGDASADSALLMALKIYETFGAYTISLDTEAEPYALNVVFTNPIDNEETLNNQMNKNAMLLLALIDNASIIRWHYTCGEDAATRTGTLDIEGASAAIGGDIKSYGSSADQVQALLDLLDAGNTAMDAVEQFAWDFIGNVIEDFESSDVRIADSKIVNLERLARYEDMMDYPIEVWLLEYRLLPEDMSKVVFAGGMEQEDGWITEYASMGQPCLIVSYETGAPVYMGSTWTGTFSEDGGQESGLRDWLESNGYLPEETYPGNHATVLFNLSDGTEARLFLSQPVRQGDTGIWCVERWYDAYNSKYLVAPDMDGLAMDYYVALQEACDNGHQPGLLDPVDVAMAYITGVLGQSVARDDLTIEYTGSYMPEAAQGPGVQSADSAHIEALIETICASPAEASDPGAYIAAHPDEYQMLLNYGDSTLRYVFSVFLKGGQTDLRSHILLSAMRSLLGGEDMGLETDTPQAWFDEWKETAVRLLEQNSMGLMEEHYPKMAMLLEMLSEAEAAAE